MLLYLSGHNHPYIAFAVNCCAQYMFITNRSHGLSLKRLGKYLKNTQDRGLVLDPNYDIFKVHSYPDADFSGMYGHERHDNPACAKSCTGFTITFDDCPILLFLNCKLKLPFL